MGERARLAPGQNVEGRYRISKLIGEGAMGSVYLAEHTMIGRRVALKLLRPDLATDPEVVERFMNEARAAGTLGHANICESTDMGFVDAVPYIVLEYLEGVVLADEIHERGALPVRRVIRIGEQIASALQAAHSAGIVHRDLKSDNVFLTDRDGRPDHVKVLDFGISEFVDAAASRSGRGLVAGTPEFMAPEQITSPGNVDARADVYALGIILHHMITGQKPFVGDDLEALLQRIVDEPVPEITRNIPVPLHLLLGRMLAKRPEDRPQSMAEVEDELARCGESYQTGPIAKVGSKKPAPAPSVASASAPARPTARGRRSLWIALGAGGAVLGALGFFIATRGPDSPAPAVVTAPPAPTPPAPTPPAPSPEPTEPRAPAAVKLVVRGDAPDARFTFRRRSYPSGEQLDLTATDVVEVVEVSAPGRKTVRFWLTLDRSATLDAKLPAGRGTAEATELETLIALGEAEPPKVEVAAKAAKVAAVEPATRPVGPTTATGPGRRVGPPPTGPSTPVEPSTPEVVSKPASGSGSAASAAHPPRVAIGSGATPGSGAPPASGAAAGTDAGVNADAGSSAPPIVAPRTPTAPARPTIDNAAVRSAVRGHLGEIQACYERGRMDNLDLAGRLVLRIAIGTDGKAQSANVESSTLNAPKVEGCIAKAVKSWQYPAPVGGPIVISYPFVLK